LPEVRTEGFPSAIHEQIQSALQPARLSPQNAAAVARLGRVLLAYDLDESALQCFERARGLDSTTFRWSYYAGAIRQGRNEHEQAVEALQEALQRSLQDAPTLLRLADSLRALNRHQDAVQSYQSLLAVMPNSARGHYGLAQSLLALGKAGDAIQSLERATRLFPRYREARNSLAEALRKKNDTAGWRAQLAALSGIGAVTPPFPDPLMEQVRQLDLSARARTASGVSLLQAGLPRAALKEFEAALAIDPRELGAHVHSIAAYQDLRDFGRAQQHYQRAVSISPDEPQTHFEYGQALFHQDRFAEAAEAFRSAVELDPGNAASWSLLGDSMLALGKTIDAERAYRRALDVDANLASAHRGVGLVHLGRSEHRIAIDHLRRAEDLPGAEALPALEALAAAFEATGDKARTIEYLYRARSVAVLHGTARKAEQLRQRILQRQP
jgi:tetratricopeptide (TPR) repeat protein